MSDVPEDWPTPPLGVTWLASHSPALTGADRAFIVTVAESPYSLLLVQDVRSSWSLEVRDLFTGRGFVVIDPDISAHARPDDILLSAIVTLDGVSTFLGPAPYTVPSDWRVEAFDMRRCYAQDTWLTREELMGMEWELYYEYRKACDRGPALELDGTGVRDPRLLRWTVSAPFAEVVERLRPLSECYDDDAITVENGPYGEPHMF